VDGNARTSAPAARHDIVRSVAVDKKRRNSRIKSLLDNRRIQSTVADSLSLALVYLKQLRDRYRLKFRIVLAIHDAILLEVPYEEVEVAIEVSERWCEELSPETEAKIAQAIAGQKEVL